METKYIKYNFEKSLERLDNIIEESDNNFEEVNYIPSRDKLTFTNGYYVNVSSLFVDIRDSSSLTNSHKRPTLAKIYRSYISEVVAILNGDSNCVEINIVGDCVSGIFKTPLQSDIIKLTDNASKINTLIKILNWKLSKKSITPIKIGIGMCYGRALMIKAGYKGSEINEIVWMGNVVNHASKLGNIANNQINNPIVISNSIYNNLNKKIKGFYTYNYSYKCYEGSTVWIDMNQWYNDNCK